MLVIVVALLCWFYYLGFRLPTKGDIYGVDTAEIYERIPIFDEIESCEWVYKKEISRFYLSSKTTFQGKVILSKENFEKIKGDYKWVEIPNDADEWLPEYLIDIASDKNCKYSKDFTYDIEYKLYFDYAITFLLVEDELAAYFALKS